MVRRGSPFALIALVACTSSAPEEVVPVAATAVAIDANTVEVHFTAAVVPGSVRAEDMRAIAPLVRPIAELAITGASVNDTVVTIETSAQQGGELYAINLGALRFDGIARADFSPQLDFRGFGTADVHLSLDTRGYQVPGPIRALITLDPATGVYSDQLHELPMAEGSTAGVYEATVSARIDPERSFAARAVGPSGEEAGALARFSVTSADAVSVVLAPRLHPVPEFDPPVDPTPGDGRAPVRIVFDDRAAHELDAPQLRSSLDQAGHFDISLTRLDALAPVPGKGRVYQVILDVAVDPNRSLDGNTETTFPYVASLVNAGEDIPQRGTTFEMKTEEPKVIVIPVGNPALVPVKFRVDVGSAFLVPDGSKKGTYPGESVFLTGEFPSASEDALGRTTADAFTGGTRVTLEMKERPDAPGIWEKTVFMPPNRPYGWKVLRCPAHVGCTELNRHVTSSGRAFPTVMKNLVTANLDAMTSSEVKVLDPAHLDQVQLTPGQVVSYAGAHVSATGTETPSPSVMFKQEVPDLVVRVERAAVTTPIVVVGTWRDVNLPHTPAEILEQDLTVDLTPYDYDQGLKGGASPIRDRTLPDDPGSAPRQPGQPAYAPTDGSADASATQLSTASGRLPLWVAWNERELYVATAPAVPGQDRFVFVSFDPPSAMRPGPWAKGGQAAASAHQAFLAMEGNGDFAGWFSRGTTGHDDAALSTGAQAGKGAVLEGTLDPAAAGLGAAQDRVWIAVVSYETQDGGALQPATQSPAGNGDFDVDAAELVEVELATVRSP